MKAIIPAHTARLLIAGGARVPTSANPTSRPAVNAPDMVTSPIVVCPVVLTFTRVMFACHVSLPVFSTPEKN